MQDHLVELGADPVGGGPHPALRAIHQARAFEHRVMPRPGGETFEPETQWIALGRMGEPEDYAGIVALLASEDGAYITGQAISVSGGMNMV